MKTFTPVVLGLIIVNVAIYLVSMLMEGKAEPFINQYLVLHKEGTAFGLRENFFGGNYNVIQTLGSAFAHAGPMHILMNMMCLFFLGPVLERRMGSIMFLIFYLFAAIVGGLITAYLDPSINRVVGASGAISGMLVAFAWLFPESRLGILFIPVHLPARIFAAIFAVFSIVMIVMSMTGNDVLGRISHFGHLAGMIAGFIFFIGYALLGKTSRRPAL